MNKKQLYEALIDTKWKQRFRFALKNESNTDFESEYDYLLNDDC